MQTRSKFVARKSTEGSDGKGQKRSSQGGSVDSDRVGQAVAGSPSPSSRSLRPDAASAIPREILAPVELCAVDGRLSSLARGFSKQPYVRADLTAALGRRKRWNFVFISHPDVLVALALSSADYAGLAFLWLYDIKAERFSDFEQMSPFARGIRLGGTLDDEAEFRHKRIHARWQRRSVDIEVTATIPDLGGSPVSLQLRFPLSADDEHLYLVVPWSDTVFNYTGKLAAIPASGELSIGSQRYVFSPDTTTASVDFTRGVWPYRIAWNWACGSGLIADTRPGKSGLRRIGMNFGAGWTDGTGVLENALYVDGKVYPLWEPVAFTFDAANLRAPWRLRTTESDRVSLTFTPIYSRRQDTNYFIIRMMLDQVMGHFSGHIAVDRADGDREVILLDQLPGIAEDHFARW